MPNIKLPNPTITVYRQIQSSTTDKFWQINNIEFKTKARYRKNGDKEQPVKEQGRDGGLNTNN